MTKRVYIYVQDDGYGGVSEHGSFFKDGIPSVDPFDVTMFMSETFLQPGMSYEAEGVKRIVKSVRNLRVSEEHLDRTTLESLEGYDNAYPLCMQRPPNIIIITPDEPTPVTKLSEIGAAVNWSSTEGTLSAHVSSRHIDSNEDLDDAVRLPLI